jgi:hypothetical protein
MMFGMTLLLSFSSTAKASQISTFSFMYGYIGGSLEFDEEAYPTSTITYNLTVVAYLEVTIYNLKVEISGLVKEEWQILHTEQIMSRYMVEDENFTTQMIVTLPYDTSGRLRCVIEASTDKGFGKATFYATYVRTTTHEELTALYDELLTNYSTLQTDHDQLLTSYHALNETHSLLVSEYGSMQTDYELLNSSYNSLVTSYDSLTLDYDSLQEDYAYVKTKYDASLGELNIVRILMYVFTVTTVVFVATTLYFKKKSPYLVLRKETAIKPDEE